MGGFSQYLQQQQAPPAAAPQPGPQTPGQLTFMPALAALKHRTAAQQQPAPPPIATAPPPDPEDERGYRMGLLMRQQGR